MDKMWLIWSNEHNAWWRWNECGYTPWKIGAGQYTYEDALRIVHNANKFCGDTPNEAMIPFEEESNK